MMRSIQILALGLAAGMAWGQTGAVSPATPIRIDAPPANRFSRLTAPYQLRSVPPVNLANSGRIDLLIRAGNLYLSSQDVVALALENNIDIEVQRYGPLLQREGLRRANAGGLLRNVGVGVTPGPSSVSLAGVAINTTGAPANGQAGAGVSSGRPFPPQIPAFPASPISSTSPRRRATRFSPAPRPSSRTCAPTSCSIRSPGLPGRRPRPLIPALTLH